MSFLPLKNPIGFGVADFIELGLAILLVAAALLWRPRIEPLLQRLAKRTAICMSILFALPLILRLALLAHHPAPTPDLYDEFGHLLVADTLRHLRLANPAHPMHRFFETFFVLQEPTYSSIYPIGQGLALALGWIVFGTPWAGVLLSTAAFCALCYWMLRGWTSPGWALAGGALAVMEFGPLNQWMNTYWGGSLTAAAGCLVFGALKRLPGRRYAVLLGVGLAVNILTRPYESIFLFAAAILFFIPAPRTLVRAWPAGIPIALALFVTLLQNRAVTGSITTMPYTLSQYQYGVPASLTFQPDPVPHRELTREQQLDYKMQSSFRGSGPETIGTFLLRMEYRVRYYRFFFLVPLYFALPFFLMSLREFRFLWVALTALLFALGINFFPAFQFHYLAAIVCLFVLIAVTGLERISQLPTSGAEAAWLLIILCLAHFLFWYGMHLFADPTAQTLRPLESWDAINHANPERRITIAHQLEQTKGKQLVFVRYQPQHIFQDEWVYNAADIDTSRIVWARDLGPEEDLKLTRYYPDRQVWLLEADARPPALAPYKPEPPPPPPPPKPASKPPLIIMEDVK